MKRRGFLAGIPVVLLSSKVSLGAENYDFPISANGYNWVTFFRRQGREWGTDWEANLAEYASTGLRAFEPGLDSAEQAKMIVKAARKNKLSMPSVYVNSLLHTVEDSAKSIASVLEIAKIVKPFGTKIMVTNPTPIAWGKPDQKTDSQLTHQAKELDKLGSLLRKEGIKLAYHTHDMEMKAGAREFHHMMQNTKPENVAFCMDVHWIYRGSENSVLPVYDMAKLYGKRIVELHIRQSTGGVWDETFTAKSDIDYTKLVIDLRQMGVKPHLVIEQCVEEKTQNTMDAVAAHKIDLKEIKSTFKRTF